MKITAWNRGPEAAALHLIPQLVLRNTWSWQPGAVKPALHAAADGIAVEPDALGMSRLYVDGNAELLFTENETNAQRLWNCGAAGYFKDGFHERIVHGLLDKVNPAKTGTKVGDGVLGDTPWPGTAALYWSEIALTAPSRHGVSYWSAMFAVDALKLPHLGSSSEFSFAVVKRPEHSLTIKVVERGGAAPGPYRAATDKDGSARIETSALTSRAMRRSSPTPNGAWGSTARSKSSTAPPGVPPAKSRRATGTSVSFWSATRRIGSCPPAARA